MTDGKIIGIGIVGAGSPAPRQFPVSKTVRARGRWQSRAGIVNVRSLRHERVD
ncbi:MAG: hypothetical protein H7Z16_11590 [Pyrinomonadaceae bacterium]|nr:hypothetical protein [Pyrinomonadaceae bacterium]